MYYLTPSSPVTWKTVVLPCIELSIIFVGVGQVEQKASSSRERWLRDCTGRCLVPLVEMWVKYFHSFLRIWTSQEGFGLNYRSGCCWFRFLRYSNFSFAGYMNTSVSYCQIGGTFYLTPLWDQIYIILFSHFYSILARCSFFMGLCILFFSSF